MYRIVLLFCVLMLALDSSVTAQDPQFSQFYAAPLYLNPAMAGSTGQARAGINYRNQWPAIDANFTTMSAYFYYFIEDYNSAVGIILNRDTEGLAGLRSISLGLQYAYELQINENLGFRPGVQIALLIAISILINLPLVINLIPQRETFSISQRPKLLGRTLAKHLLIFHLVVCFLQDGLARRICVALDNTESKYHR